MTETISNSTQRTINERNEAFWAELCGSTQAKKLGIYNQRNSQALEIFDAYYFDTYPYIYEHIRFSELKDKEVLEVGLGYGTIGQRIVESGAYYTGVDIADGPVSIMKHRLQENTLKGSVCKENFLDNDIMSESKDYVISIGCYHHTGNVKKCIDETYRILRPGGIAIIMIYNQFSYRQWLRWPVKTFMRFIGQKSIILESQKSSYDFNTCGQAAPETVFLSIKELKEIFSNFKSVSFNKENINISIPLIGKSIRKFLLPVVGKICGLDIYIKAQK